MLSIIGIIAILVIAIAIELPVEFALTFVIIWLQNLFSVNDWPFDFEYVGMIFLTIICIRASIINTINHCRK